MDYFRRFVAAPAPTQNPAHWAVGELAPGDAILSATRAFKLIFQRDGNLVLYEIDDVALSYELAVRDGSRHGAVGVRHAGFGSSAVHDAE